MLKKSSSFIILIFIFFLSTSICSQVGTAVDSLRKKTLTAVAAGNLKDALSFYDDLYTITYKEDVGILENICLSVIKELQKSSDTDFKISSLNLLDKVINVPLGRSLIVFFNDNDAEVRELAVNIIAKYNNDLLYPEISSLLSSNDLYSVVSALTFIKKVKSKIFIDVVTKLLDHEDIFIKSLAIEAIASINPDSEEIIAKLSELITHSSPKIRASTVKALDILQADQEMISKAVKDNDYDVQIALLEWSRNNPSNLADRIIRTNLQSANHEIYAKACRAALASEKMAGRVRWDKLIEHPDARIRLLALKAITKAEELFDDEDITLKFLSDDDKKIRETAARSVLEAEDTMLSESVIELVIDSVNLNAIDALVSIWAEDKDILFDPKYIADIISKNNDFLTGKVISVLNRLPSEMQSELVEKVFASNIFTLKKQYFQYLLENSMKEAAVLYVNKGLESPSIEVRSSAIKCLGIIGEGQEEQLKQLFTSKYWLERKSCIQAVENFNDDNKISWVEAGLKDKSGEVRLQALKLAKTIEESDSVTNYFVDSLFDEYEPARRFALEFLENPDLKEEQVEEADKEEIKDPVETKKEAEVTEPEKQEIKKSPNSKLMSWLKSGTKKKNKEAISFKRDDSEAIQKLEIDNKETKRKENLQKKLNNLLKVSKDNNTKKKAEVFLLEMGDEDSLKNIKNRLDDESVEKRKEAAEKLGYLKDSSVIPVLREQLKNEEELPVKFELAFAIWKILPYLKK